MTVQSSMTKFPIVEVAKIIAEMKSKDIPELGIEKNLILIYFRS